MRFLVGWLLVAGLVGFVPPVSLPFSVPVFPPVSVSLEFSP